MTQRLHDQIRDIIETTPGLTQRGLADCMGLNPAAVNRMLYGRRNIMAEEIPIIESYLGRTLAVPAVAVSVRPAVPVSRADVALAQVPVLDAPFSSRPPVDWVPRHPAQAGLADAFALYVPNDVMAPRYFAGELVYVHPHRPPELPRDVVVAPVDPAVGDPAFFIARLLAQDADTMLFGFFNPAEEKRQPRAGLRNPLCIVGRG